MMQDALVSLDAATAGQRAGAYHGVSTFCSMCALTGPILATDERGSASNPL